MDGSEGLEENLGQPADLTEKAVRPWELSIAARFTQLASRLHAQEPLAVCHYVNKMALWPSRSPQPTGMYKQMTGNKYN